MTFLSGLQAVLKSAADNHVSAVFGVPGSPTTDVVTAFQESPEFSSTSEWFMNEKIAFEWALGTSFSGKRSLVVVKHVGMNVLADPLMTSMIHTIGAGLVILVGDDPEVTGSQNSQDSRYYGNLSRSPVFDPSTPQEIYNFLTASFQLSEKIKAPVIVRVTAAILNDEAEVKAAADISAADSGADLKTDKYVWQYRMKGRYQRSHYANDSVLSKTAADFCRIGNAASGGENSLGIITSGFCYSRTIAVLKSMPNIPVLKIGVVSPLPIEQIRQFLEKHKTVLVIEESEPVIEDQIRVYGNVIGKRSGHLPFGSTAEAHILSAIENSNQPSVPISTNIEMFKRPADNSYFCDGCLYPAFYEMLGRLKEKTKLPVTGDIGCSMYGIVAPFSVLDSAVSLGAGIGIGSGVSRAVGKKSIAVIGDFGFFHSGLLSLIEAAEKGVSELVYVMHNSAAAMTGGQAVYDPENLIRAAVQTGSIPDQSTIQSFDFDVSATGEVLNNEMQLLFEASSKEIEKEGISVIIVRWKCRKHK
ncbi:thiamine pyrophosphate-dependent enzyme [Methanimicrococcus blatticola]|uniref:Indolepyruvate oxidoreductase subunit IorA n=1 Tax=Methanimicrococcus blatticola TaxID=91560 RepID=A0A484F7E2_9EURY|nr:thiamine pyrophosphate-dependent enzyme [Methanimicrococcus blatticola]MBZ3934879.1 hypothetical protein [Methanimicrococcus blatticola]MCC2509022.1 thiamine pyrophosphate-dependent enzyme [Methanimicrococcus blatticola]TDQ70951.1 indolepyruvate ferredoxin oxidoreductase alpha subunit [Methanimicrococcus blatticola]